MALYNAVLVRLGEYMVRYGSSYRDYLVNQLRLSVEKVLARSSLRGDARVVGGSRIIVYGVKDEYLDRYVSVLKRVFGVSSISPAIAVEYDLGLIIEYVGKLLARSRPRSFKVVVEGEPGYDRLLLSKIIASKIIEDYGLRLDLENPEETVVVEIREGSAFIMDQVFEGPGGLPYGVEGCLATLVSGGVDSALATWYLLKRGVEPVLVYVDMGGFWSVEAHKRFEESLKYVFEWVPWDSLKLYIVPGYGELLAKTKIPDHLRCLLCKTGMYRIASLIADREGCPGIATGESVGQVASQTLINLSTISRIIDKPIYRPVAFKDKLEIIEEARRKGFDKLSRSVGTCKLKPWKPETSIDEKGYEIIKQTIKEMRGELEKLVERSVKKIIKAQPQFSI